MKVRITLTGQVIDARLTRDHPASSYGQPVVVTSDGEALDWAFLEVVEADPAETQVLRECLSVLTTGRR